MLTQNQIVFFNSNGFLVVEDVLDQATVLDPVRTEYAAFWTLLSQLGWHRVRCRRPLPQTAFMTS